MMVLAGLAVIIPTINCRRYVQQVVETLPGLGETVTVIDNGSTDDTPAWMATLPDRIQTIRLPENIGVAPVWNYGIRLAFEQGFTTVAVLNHDLVLAWDTLIALCRWHRRGVHVPTVQAVQDLRQRRLNQCWRPGDFCGFLVTPDVMQRAGWFDEGYQLAYLEDLDFEMRLLEAGLRHGRCQDALVIHYGSRAIVEGGVQHAAAWAANVAYFQQKWGQDYESARTQIASAGQVFLDTVKT